MVRMPNLVAGAIALALALSVAGWTAPRAVAQEPTTGVAPKPKATWKAQEDFHSVLAGTFHPMEDGDFRPVRKRAGEMARKARLWSRSKPPEGYDAAKIRPLLTRLEREAAELARLVARQAADEDIKRALNQLHDTYHAIAGECR
ncbi:MAG: hypothetical protein NZ585_01695 [Chloracidobacterium sp.]|nr:hypothetical protein [Chloracidobacterium sp.]MDW8216279.1 hypothetical protein [Acidobacteriota bacterium]